MNNTIVSGVEENIFRVMWENTPTITIFFFGVFLSGFVVYQAMKFYGRFEKTEETVSDLVNRVTKVEQRLDAIEIRLVVIETRLDVLEQKVDKLGEKFDRLNEKFDRLIEILLVKNKESS